MRGNPRFSGSNRHFRDEADKLAGGTALPGRAAAPEREPLRRPFNRTKRDRWPRASQGTRQGGEKDCCTEGGICYRGPSSPTMRGRSMRPSFTGWASLFPGLFVFLTQLPARVSPVGRVRGHKHGVSPPAPGQYDKEVLGFKPE